MSSDGTSQEAIPPSQKETLIQYDERIVGEKDNVIDLFDSMLSKDTLPDKIDPIGDRLSWILSSEEQSTEETNDIINAILNTSINFGVEVRQELQEIEVDEELIEIFEYISINHGTELERQANRRTKGADWWSNISTSVVSKNGGAVLSHEFTVDMDKKVTIANNMHGSHLLVRHVLEQTKSARNIIGEDVLENVERDLLEDIQETVDDILEELEEFESEEEVEVSESEVNDAE